MTADPNQTVRLRNGDEGPAHTVAAIAFVIRKMMAEDGIPGILKAYDLREWCRDPSSVPTDRQQQFKDMGFGGGSDGGAHDLVRSIVASALVGDGLFMHFQSPIDQVAELATNGDSE